jgi:hypothetical protein
VIDTTYFYTVAESPNGLASVRDISEQILGAKLPDTHDSIQDARASLQVNHEPVMRFKIHCSIDERMTVTLQQKAKG